MRTQAKRRSRRDYLDRLVRQIVRERDEVCRMGPLECDGPLQVCHIFPRRMMSVRFDLENLVLLCLLHHRWFDEEGMARWQWVINQLGAERYEALAARAMEPWDKDYDRALAELKALKAAS